MTCYVALDGPIIRIVLSGTLSAADMLSVGQEVGELERTLAKVPDRIVDMSGVVATGFAFELTMEIARRRREQVFPNAFRSAILAPTRDSAGFARIFQVLSNNPQIEVQLFATLREAEEWLGVPRSP